MKPKKLPTWPQITRAPVKAVDSGRQSEQRVIQIPVGSNEWVALQLPTPMSEEAWNQMMAVLAAMKPGLIKHEHEAKGAPQEHSKA